MAYNLYLNGWVDYAYILVDESVESTYPKLRHFCDVLKSDPFSAQIGILHTIQHTSAYVWKENPDTETDPTFKGRLDIWTPENNDNANYYFDNAFTEHNMDLDEEEIWCYYTRSACLNIDSRGLNNRALPMRNYFMHSKGILDWGTFIYGEYKSVMYNPWIDPIGRDGNGALAFFYPPGDTIPAAPDLTITPSMRMELLREGVEDYEYMVILDDWMDTAAANSVDTTTAQYLVEEMHSMFLNPVEWSVNDEYYLLLREQIADEIDKLKWYSTYGQPEAEVAGIKRVGNDVEISLFAKEFYRYNLLHSDQLINPSWVVVDTTLVTSGDTIILIDDSLGSTQKAFYKIEVLIP